MIEDEKGLLLLQDVGIGVERNTIRSFFFDRSLTVRCQILKTRFLMHSFDLGNSKTKTVNTWT